MTMMKHGWCKKQFFQAQPSHDMMPEIAGSQKGITCVGPTGHCIHRRVERCCVYRKMSHNNCFSYAMHKALGMAGPSTLVCMLINIWASQGSGWHWSCQLWSWKRYSPLIWKKMVRSCDGKRWLLLQWHRERWLSVVGRHILLELLTFSVAPS